MFVTPKEENNEQPQLSKEELKYKIEIATQTLDRNIGFITNCDNKTSIILTAVGVLLTIILTNEGLNEIFCIVISSIKAKTALSILYLVCFAGAVFVVALGMYTLGSVLVAKTTDKAIGKTDAPSRIFFFGIRNNTDFKTYYDRFHDMSNEDLLNDLIEQIYINADIAFTKYEKYNRGLKYTIIGFVSFIVFFLVGIIVY